MLVSLRSKLSARVGQAIEELEDGMLFPRLMCQSVGIALGQLRVTLI